MENVQVAVHTNNSGSIYFFQWCVNRETETLPITKKGIWHWIWLLASICFAPQDFKLSVCWKLAIKWCDRGGLTEPSSWSGPNWKSKWKMSFFRSLAIRGVIFDYRSVTKRNKILNLFQWDFPINSWYFSNNWSFSLGPLLIIWWAEI